MTLAELEHLLMQHGVGHSGVRRFADCLPLLPGGAARRVPDGARSVIVCLFPWNIGPAGDDPRRNVARYAVLPDYHRVAGGILDGLVGELRQRHPNERHAAFVDSSPFREVAAASGAGLGVVGRHGLLIHPVFGAQVFVGEIVTTLEIPPTPSCAGSCLGCGACLRACPTGALVPEGPLDRGRCRSHITQKKGSLTHWEQEQIRHGALVWGCDRCMDACPMNTGALSPIREFYRDPAPVLDTANLDALLPGHAYNYRGRAVLERNLRLLAQSEGTPNDNLLP